MRTINFHLLNLNMSYLKLQILLSMFQILFEPFCDKDPFTITPQ
jgi:hypothetical protein